MAGARSPRRQPSGINTRRCLPSLPFPRSLSASAVRRATSRSASAVRSTAGGCLSFVRSVGQPEVTDATRLPFPPQSTQCAPDLSYKSADLAITTALPERATPSADSMLEPHAWEKPLSSCFDILPQRPPRPACTAAQHDSVYDGKADLTSSSSGQLGKTQFATEGFPPDSSESLPEDFGVSLDIDSLEQSIPPLALQRRKDFPWECSPEDTSFAQPFNSASQLLDTESTLWTPLSAAAYCQGSQHFPDVAMAPPAMQSSEQLGSLRDCSSLETHLMETVSNLVIARGAATHGQGSQDLPSVATVSLAPQSLVQIDSSQECTQVETHLLETVSTLWTPSSAATHGHGSQELPKVSIVCLSPRTSVAQSGSPRDSEFGLADWQFGIEALLDAQHPEKKLTEIQGQDSQQLEALQSELAYWKEKAADVMIASKCNTKAARQSLVFLWRAFDTWHLQVRTASRCTAGASKHALEEPPKSARPLPASAGRELEYSAWSLPSQRSTRFQKGLAPLPFPVAVSAH